MNWLKKGLLFEPNLNHSFGKTRIMCPTPFLIDKNCLRIYAGFCDSEGISRIGFVDVKPDNPSIIINVSQKPVLDIGFDGTFDDNGLCPTSIFKDDNKLYLYYFGFQQGVKVPFYMFSGLAISSDNGNSFVKYSNVPILDRSNDEPIMRSGPFVFKDESTYKMIYPSGNEFVNVNGKLIHTYNLKYLESNDGLNWGGSGKTILELNKTNSEFGFGRPFLIKKDGKYLLFYSIRTYNLGYRLGFSESTDHLNWKRKDAEIGIDISLDGWDSEMICYPSLFKHNNKLYLFYNGNNLGKTGFGYAELEN